MQYRDLKWLINIIVFFLSVCVFSDSDFEKGALYLENGEYDKAETIFRSILSERPDDTNVLNNLGVVFFMKKDYTVAYNYFETAIRIRPDYRNAYYNAGLVLFIRKMWPELSEFASNAIRKFPDQRKELELLISYSYYRLRRFDEGYMLFRNIRKQELPEEYWNLYDWVEKKYRIIN